MSTVHFSDILMVLKNPRFKCCERICTIDFPTMITIVWRIRKEESDFKNHVQKLSTTS